MIPDHSPPPRTNTTPTTSAPQSATASPTRATTNPSSSTTLPTGSPKRHKTAPPSSTRVSTSKPNVPGSRRDLPPLPRLASRLYVFSTSYPVSCVCFRDLAAADESEPFEHFTSWTAYSWILDPGFLRWLFWEGGPMW